MPIVWTEKKKKTPPPPPPDQTEFFFLHGHVTHTPKKVQKEWRMTGSATREFLFRGGQKPLPILGMGLHLAWPLPPPR